jgi:hypothetical protein
VIGGYTPGSPHFDALLVGYYKGRKLLFVAKVRAGLTPALREPVFWQLRGLVAERCPFRNLPEPRRGRWGEGLTIEEMRNAAGSSPNYARRSNTSNGLRPTISVTSSLLRRRTESHVYMNEILKLSACRVAWAIRTIQRSNRTKHESIEPTVVTKKRCLRGVPQLIPSRCTENRVSDCSRPLQSQSFSNKMGASP